MNFVPVQHFISKLLADYAEGKPLESQLERDTRSFEAWEAQPDPDEEDEV
jgi:hypothetical protein